MDDNPYANQLQRNRRMALGYRRACTTYLKARKIKYNNRENFSYRQTFSYQYNENIVKLLFYGLILDIISKHYYSFIMTV